MNPKINVHESGLFLRMQGPQVLELKQTLRVSTGNSTIFNYTDLLGIVQFNSWYYF